MRRFALSAPVLLLLSLLIQWGSLWAAPVQVPVSALASDVVYLGAGASEGLLVGMKGELRAADGRRAELEVLYVSSGRSSCRVSPAGVEVRIGDPVWFDLNPPSPSDTLAIVPPTSAQLPPAAVAAIERAATERGPWMKGWWRLDGTHSQLEDGSTTRGRQAVGLRFGLAQHKDVVLSIQLRNRSEWSPQASQEGWMDELSLAGSSLKGRIAWEAGRMADGRGALPGPVDGVAMESAVRGPLVWGLSAGSRPASTDQQGKRATGVGGRLRWQPQDGPLSSDFKARGERSAAGVSTAGTSWSNQFRFLQKGRLEHWIRAEFSESNNWNSSISRFTSTRVRWVDERWQVEGRHQFNTLPVQIPDELQSGPSIDNRRSQLVEMALSRQWSATWLQARVQGRGEKLDGDLERLLELSASRSTPRGLLSRVSSSLLAYLGPENTGQDLELRLSAAPAKLPELELGLRGWRVGQQGRNVTGWNSSLYVRGRLWKGLRWEGGGLLQHEDGLWMREVRAGLRGDLNLKLGRAGETS